MKNLEMFAVVPKDLPSVDYWTETRELPTFPGIYFVIRHDEVIAYVGKASSLRSRWSGGHHINPRISRHAGCHRIHYIECEVACLDSYEAYFIHKYTPPLNIAYPDIQAHELIKMAESGALSYKEAFTVLAARTKEFGQRVKDHMEAISRMDQEKDRLQHEVMQDLVEALGIASDVFTQSINRPESNHVGRLLKTVNALVHSKTRVLELEAKVKELEAINIQIDANSRN